MKFKSIKDVNIFLRQIPKFSEVGSAAANYSLDNIKDFCRSTGNIQAGFSAIHVAGTNGKGSVCRIISSILQSTGKKTGLYTSPHLLDYRERFRINSQKIEQPELIQFFNLYGQKINRYQLTYFEISTALAFWWFAKKKVDIAVIETGLGGRLDATNILDPLLSIITTVASDHEDILGEGIENIAREKAGIIKNNTPVVAGYMPEDARKIISRRAKAQKAPYESMSASHLFNHKKIDKYEHLLSVAGVKKQNLALALQALKKTKFKTEITSKVVEDALIQYQSRYPHTGCFSRLRADLRWYFDGAHNKQAIQNLKKELITLAPIQEWTVIFCMMKDKVNKEVLNEFFGFKKICYYQDNGTRTTLYSKIISFLPAVELCPADDKMKRTKFLKDLKSQLVIFTGSFYFYKSVKEWVGQVK